ncbi:MAG: efflux RND transporter permease subunit, partial [Bacteroidota bacterium]
METKNTNQEQKTREFWLSTLALNNRISVFVLATIIIIFGVVSYQQTSKELYPEIVLPQIYVNTIYPGNSPADMENLITRPIEKEIKSVKGVTEINSTSVQDVSAILVEFEEDADVTKALTDVKDAVDRAKSELPSDLEMDPSVQELDFSEAPIMFINLSGEFEVDKLKEYAEYLQDEIEEISEVSEAQITGAVDREIQINADLYRMEAMKVSFSDIERAVSSENLSISGGDLLTNGSRRSIRIMGEFTTAQQIENIIIKSEQQQPIYLRDVAEVKDTYEERKGYARLATEEFVDKGNAPVISLLVKKRSGENLIEADEKIKAILAEAKKNVFPSSLEVVITNEQSDEIRSQISNLLNSIISGVILVVVVLLFFMGLRNALLVGAAIPLSMLITFIILNFSGVTMNIVVLFSLIIALGMLVDNAVVVIENIIRLMEQGMKPLQAAREGVGEVAMPIIFSTGTTLAGFVPLAFWGGLMGEFMKYMPITLIIVLASSLFVGLVINPVFTKVFAKVKSSKADTEKRRKLALVLALGSTLIAGILYTSYLTGIHIEYYVPSLALLLAFISFTLSYILRKSKHGGKLVTAGATLSAIGVFFGIINLTGGVVNYTYPNLLMTFSIVTFLNLFALTPASNWFQTKFLPRVENSYISVLRFFLKGARPFLLIVAMFFVMVGSIVLMFSNAPAVEFFPNGEPKQVMMFVELPLGTDIEQTDGFIKSLEKRVFKTLEPYKAITESIVTNVGEATEDPQKSMGGGGGSKPHRAKFTIAFVEFKERGGMSTAAAMRDLSEAVKDIPGVKIVTSRDEGGPPTGKPVSIEIVGEDYKVLLAEAERLKRNIEDMKISGIDQLEIEAETGKPELVLSIDREKALKYGLSTGLVATTIRTALFGKEVSKFKDGDDDHPIQLRLAPEYRYDLENLMNQRITFRDNRGNVSQIPISSVAEVDFASSLGEIKRKDLDRVVTVSSNTKEGANANEIVGRIRNMMETSFELPDGYTYRFGGEQEEQAKSMAFLVNAFLMALAAIFFLLVTQFNSVTQPFIIFISILFSTTGVFLGLFIFRDNFVIIMTGVGIISLAGVVVNNAIVLVDYMNLTVERRKQELGLTNEESLPLEDYIECVVQGGYARLRPVLLT